MPSVVSTCGRNVCFKRLALVADRARADGPCLMQAVSPFHAVLKHKERTA